MPSGRSQPIRRGRSCGPRRRPRSCAAPGPRCGASCGPVGASASSINLLALVSSIYMMEVFDRVLTSGSRRDPPLPDRSSPSPPRQSSASSAACGAASWSGSGTGSSASSAARRIDASVSLRLAGGGRDGGRRPGALADIKAFFASESVVAFLDAPWAPVFLPRDRALHPALGVFALAAALLLVLLRARQRGADAGAGRGRGRGRAAGAAAWPRRPWRSPSPPRRWACAPRCCAAGTRRRPRRASSPWRSATAARSSSASPSSCATGSSSASWASAPGSCSKGR